MDTDSNSDLSENSSSDSAPQQENNSNKMDRQEDQNSHPHEDRIDSINKWVSEIGDTSNLEDNEGLDECDSPQDNHQDLPDWISTLSYVTDDSLESKSESDDDQESKETISLETQDDTWDVEPIIEEADIEEDKEKEIPQPDNGFIEISKDEFIEESEAYAQIQPQDSIEEQEIIPEWLEEMFDESTETIQEGVEIPSNDQAVVIKDESTKPVTVPEVEAIDDDMLSEQELQEEIPISTFPKDETELTEEKEYLTEPEPLDLSQQEEEIPEIIPELVEEFVSELAEEKWQEEIEQPLNKPKTLRFAKYLLEQGEIDPAVEILQTYLKKPEHLDEIKTWVIDTVVNKNRSTFNLWELIGDIAMVQNEAHEALSAYTNAIALLLRDHKEFES